MWQALLPLAFVGRRRLKDMPQLLSADLAGSWHMVSYLNKLMTWFKVRQLHLESDRERERDRLTFVYNGARSFLIAADH